MIWFIPTFSLAIVCAVREADIASLKASNSYLTLYAYNNGAFALAAVGFFYSFLLFFKHVYLKFFAVYKTSSFSDLSVQFST